MGRGIPRKPLYLHRKVDKPLDLLIGIVQRFQLRNHFQRSAECNFQHSRNEFGYPVHILIRYSQNPSDIAHRTPRRHSAKGHYLRHMVAAVLAANVLNYLRPALILEVNIEIGHADAFRIEEAFEQQIVFYRIKVGDAYRIGGNARRAAASSGPDGDDMGLCKVDKIPYYQVVIDKAHSLYYA